MRCCCCNANLNDFESTLKGAASGQYLDMCRKCLKDLDIQTLSNPNEPEEQGPEEDFWYENEDIEFIPFTTDDE